MTWCQKLFAPSWLRWIRERRLCKPEKAFSFTGLWCLIPLGSWMSENKQMRPFSEKGKIRIVALFIHHENSEWTRTLQKNQISVHLVEQLHLAERMHLVLTLETEQLEMLLVRDANEWPTAFSSKLYFLCSAEIKSSSALVKVNTWMLREVGGLFTDK